MASGKDRTPEKRRWRVGCRSRAFWAGMLPGTRKKGYKVVLVEASVKLSGRGSRENRLPGLAEWARVRDHRILLLEKMENVAIYHGSELSAKDILEFSAEDKFGFSHVFLAAGAIWLREGLGREHREPIPGLEQMLILTPDDLMDGIPVNGKVLIFDENHYYMGGVLAEKLRKDTKSCWLHLLLTFPHGLITRWNRAASKQG